MAILRRHVLSIVAAAVLLAVYLVVLRLMPRDVFWHPDEGSKFIQLHSIHWNRGLRYDVPYGGVGIDPQYRFFPGRGSLEQIYPTPRPDGTVSFRWPIWFVLLTRPFTGVFGMMGIYLVPLIAGWLTAVLAARMAYVYRPELAPVALLLVGLATPVCFYSMCFSEHTLATLAGLTALSMAALAPPGSLAALCAVPLLLLVAVVLRFEMLAFAMAVIVAWAATGLAARGRPTESTQAQMPSRQTRRAVPLAAVGAVALVCVVILIAALNTRHLQYFATIQDTLKHNWRKLPYLKNSLVDIFINSLGMQGRLVSRAWEVAALCAVGAALVAPFAGAGALESALIVPALALLLEFSTLIALASRPYISRQGIFTIAPYMVVGWYVIPYAWRQRRYDLLCLASAAALYVVTGFAALFSIRVGLDGNYLMGLDGPARYFLTIYPLLAVLSVMALHLYRASDRRPLVRSAVTILVTAMMLVSVQYQFRGLQALYNHRHLFATWKAAFPEAEPVVTDEWWLPAAMAPFFLTHTMFCVTQPAEVAEWAAAASAGGVQTFTFASFKTADLGHLGSERVQLAPEEQRFVEGLYLTRVHLERPPQVNPSPLAAR